MTSGQGGAMPFGFGGYGMVNHPEYMKAISSSVDPEQLDHMLDDPHTQGMIEQMMNDPDTLKYLLE